MTQDYTPSHAPTFRVSLISDLKRPEDSTLTATFFDGSEPIVVRGEKALNLHLAFGQVANSGGSTAEQRQKLIFSELVV